MVEVRTPEKIKEGDQAIVDLLHFIQSHPGEEETSLYDTVEMMALLRAYVLAGRQEEEDMAILSEYFDTGTEFIRTNYSAKCTDPDFLEAIRDSGRRFLRSYPSGDPDETWQKLVNDLISFCAPSRTKPTLPEAARNLLFDPYIHILNGELTNALFNLSLDQFDKDPYTGVATLERSGMIIQVEGYTEFLGQISPSPLKLWDAITAYLTFNNPYKARKGIQCILEIPLVEYASVRGIDLSHSEAEDPKVRAREDDKRAKRERDFKADIERDLDNLARFRITAKIKNGRNAGDYDKIALITPDHSIKSGIIQVTVPPKTAEYLLNSYVMTYAPKIQSLPDNNSNLYPIARKLLLHNSIDNNYASGTNNTLKVCTIISSTPHIPDLETLKQRGQRNWKDKIKKPLETVFRRLEESGFLIEWEYRNAHTRDLVTITEAGKLTDNEYVNLNVDYRLMDNPLQTERQKRKEEEKKTALEEKEKEQETA